MIRTRDVFLYLLSVGFLLIAIVTTALVKAPSRDGGEPLAMAPTVIATDIQVEADTQDGPDRASRIADLRSKILALNPEQEEVIQMPPEEELETAVESEEEIDEELVLSDSSSSNNAYCPMFATSTTWWPASGVMMDAREGIRLVYVETVTPPLFVSSSTEPEVTEDVLLQLPIRLLPHAETNCLSSDVVGIALDGSLIHNQDYTAYRIFEQHTLIGYALDGFPIYGTAPGVATDQCGGAIVDGSYRYYLSPERAGMLGCYSGTPVKL